MVDPGLREVQGPGLGVDRLLIYWQTNAGPHHVAVPKSPVSDCYNLLSTWAFDVGDAIVFVWSKQPETGVRLPRAPDFEPNIADPESGMLILPIDVCLDARGVVTTR